VPTYEYECQNCHRVFEVRQRISDPPLTVCDGCGGEVRRLLSPAPFILKGEGWYVTDYPSAARKKALESEKGGTDSKPSADKSSGEQSSTPSTPAATPSTGSSGSSSAPSSSSTSSTSTPSSPTR
jgi:putative FmdB family regulatory protein